MSLRGREEGRCLTLEVCVSQDCTENSWVPVVEFPDHGFLFSVCVPHWLVVSSYVYIHRPSSMGCSLLGGG